jgi:hypothetical protein
MSATTFDEIGYSGGAHPTILARVTEIGHHRCDSTCRCAPECVNDEQQLHQIIVCGLTGALQHEYVFTTNVLVKLDGHFTIGKLINLRAT